MKKFLIAIGALIVFGGTAYGYAQWRNRTAENPDPTHTHADVAVWVLGQRLDFSDDRYMSGLSTDETTHDEDDERHDPYLHLHDGIGHVIHRHKDGLTLGAFFASIGMPMTETCLTLDAFQFAKIPAGRRETYGLTPELCDNGKFRWTMIVNDLHMTPKPDYVFNDLDAILLSYGASDTAAAEEWKEMTDDACLYSKTCPGRGDPPAESCVADPNVPCVDPSLME